MRMAILALGALATLATSLATTAPASADPWGPRIGYDAWHERHGGWRSGYHRHRGSDALTAGAIGLGVGVLVGTIATSNDAYRGGYVDRYYRPYRGSPYRNWQETRYADPYPEPRYYTGVVVERRVVEVPARPIYVERRAPRRHYVATSPRATSVAACARRYKTYDARTHTFVGNDHRRHLCRL